MRPSVLVLVLAIPALAACTSSAPEDGVVDDELLRAESPRVQREGLRADQGDPSRTGDCPQLSGQALRDCMERAQYQPEGAQGSAGDAQTRRQPPAQALPARVVRPPAQDADGPR